MSLAKDVLGCVKVDVDAEKLAAVLADGALKPALEKIVADTENSFDDKLLEYVLPLLRKALVEAVTKLDEKL